MICRVLDEDVAHLEFFGERRTVAWQQSRCRIRQARRVKISSRSLEILLLCRSDDDRIAGDGDAVVKDTQ